MLYMGALDKGQSAADKDVLAALDAVVRPMRNVECIYQLTTGDDTILGRVAGTGKKEILARTPAIDLLDPDELTRFVDWTHQHYPSRYTALFLKDHGTGIDTRPPASDIHLTGIFVDGNKSMPVTALRTAIERTKRGRVDVYGLDACEMAWVELGYEVREVSSFFIATEVMEKNTGWHYENIVCHLEDCGESLGPRELTPYVVEQSKEATSANTIALEVAWMDELADAIEALAHELFARVGEFAPWAAARYADPPTDMVDLAILIADLRADPAWQSLLSLAAVGLALREATRAGNGLVIFLPLQAGSRAFATYGALEFPQTNYWARLVSTVNSVLLAD